MGAAASPEGRNPVTRMGAPGGPKGRTGGPEEQIRWHPRPRVDYAPPAHVAAVQTRLYSFHFTSTGRVGRGIGGQPCRSGRMPFVLGVEGPPPGAAR